jgi:hypothetical protein
LPPHPQFRLALAAAGIVICLAYLGGGARGIGVAERDVLFSPAVDPQVQLGAPETHVPVGAPATLSSLGARGSLSVALGRRSAIRDFAAVSAAAAAVAFGAVLHAAGLPAVVVIAAMLGMSVGETFWWRGTTYTADTLFPLLLLLAIWAALGWQRSHRKPIAILAAICAVLAIADFVRPMAGGMLRTATAPGFMASLAREFTPLGLFLAGIGMLVLLRSRATRIQAAIIASVLLVWHGVWRSALEPVNVILVIGGWWSIAIALAWLHGLTTERARHVVVAAAAVMLIVTPVATRTRLHALGRDLPAQERIRLANELRIADAPEGAMVIAESRRADAAMLLSARLASRPVTMLPQAMAEVASALESARPIIAFPNAVANLELFGFLFERAAIGGVEVARVAGHVPCVPLQDDTWTDVSLLAAHGSLIVHGASNAAPANVVIRMAASRPVTVAGVEPRDAGLELGDVPAEGVSNLLDIAHRAESTAVSTLRIVPGNRRGPVTVAFASPPAYAVATAEDPIPTMICPGIQRSGVTLASARTADASVPMNDNAPFGSGWHPVEADPDFFRWTAAPESSLRIAITHPSAVRVTITATPASRPAQKPSIGLRVNDCRLDTHAMQAGQGDYEWIVEERCWRAGVNQLWIATTPLISPSSLFATHDTRLLGARIGAIRLARAN